MKTLVSIINKDEEFIIPKEVNFIDKTKYHDYSFLKSKNDDTKNMKFAYVTYYNKNGNKEKIEKYKYINFKEAEEMIFDIRNKFIDLSGYYVDNIKSLFNAINNGNESKSIEIKEFIARDSFFHTTDNHSSGGVFEKEICFSKIKFVDKVDFSNSVFSNNIVFKDVDFSCEAKFSFISCMRNLHIIRSTFNYNLNINESLFNGILRINESCILGKTDFTRSIFKDFVFVVKSEFNEVIFVNSLFEGKVHFKSNVTFNGIANFKNVIFQKLVEFNNKIKFNSKLNFKRVKCNANSVFFKTEFNNAEFNNTIFEDNVYFIDSIFKKNIKYWSVKFNGETHFKLSKFKKNVYFDNSKFKDIVYFYNTIIESELRLERCDFHSYVDLRVKKCKYINLEESINRNILDFKPRKNDEIKIEKINFYNIKNLGYIYIDWYKNEVKKIIKNNSNDYSNNIEQFRMLKENYKELGQYDYEDKAYVEFKKMNIREEPIFYFKQLKKGFKSVFKNLFSFLIIFLKFCYFSIKFLFNYLFQELIGVYGTKPFRIFLFMIVVVIFFTIYYLKFFPNIDFNSIYELIGSQELKKSLYHSIITFLTIGYGSSSFSNINDNIILIVSSGIEGFSGMFLMAYFTVAFVRKVLR